MPGLALTAIAVLVLINGFFVAAEFALVSARRERLQGGSLGVRLVHKQLGRLDEYLSACQLGITIASLALGALGEPTIAHLLEPWLDSTFLAHFAAVLATVLALLIMTSLHITVGEQAPKSFAIGSAERVAKACALPLEIFYRCLRPLVVVLNNASNGIVRLFGGTPASSHAQQASLEELRQLIGGMTEGGHLDKNEAQILQGVFTLDERRAADVMTPRTRVSSIRVGQTVREALESVRSDGHSRWPLVDPANDGPLGAIYGRELTEAILDGDGDKPVERFRHSILIVPATVPLDVLLARMQEARVSICAVVGEYGELDGLVTVEDIVEEIVGEIWDEDDSPDEIHHLADGRVVARGDTSILDLTAHGIELQPTPNSSSIGGLIQEQLDRLPRKGDHLNVDHIGITVLAVDRGRVQRALLQPPPATAHDAHAP